MIREHACITIACDICNYRYDEDEYTAHFADLAEARKALTGTGWTITADRKVFCASDDIERTAMVEHIARCWQNPAAHACKTCAHFEPADPDGPYPEHPGWPEGCAQERDLTAGLQVHCPSWQPAA